MKNKFRFQILMIIAMLSVLVGCATTDDGVSTTIPDWYLSGKLSGYGSESHLVGVGEGYTLEDAIASAQAMIGGQLKVSVESTVESFRQETSMDGQINFFEIFSESSTITVDETLKGSRIIEQELVDGTHYVFAALHIQTFLTQLVMDMGELERRSQTQLSYARRSIQQGAVLTAMEQYRNAYEAMVEYYSKRAYVEAIAPAQVPKRAIGAEEIVSETRSMLAAVQLSVTSGDHQEAPAGVELTDPIEFQVRYQPQKGDAVPVPRIPVTIRSPDKSAIGRYTTDTEGKIAVRVTAVPQLEQSGSITATIDMYAIMGVFAGAVGRPEAVAHYAVMTSAQRSRIMLELYDTEGNRLNELERAVGRDMADLGFAVSEDQGDWRLQGVCHVLSRQEISGYQGRQFVATVEIELSLFQVGNDAILHRKLVSGSAMSTIDHAEAIRRACAAIRIDKMMLATLLAGINR